MTLWEWMPDGPHRSQGFMPALVPGAYVEAIREAAEYDRQAARLLAQMRRVEPLVELVGPQELTRLERSLGWQTPHRRVQLPPVAVCEWRPQLVPDYP